MVYNTKRLVKEYEESEKARVERDIDYRKVKEAIKGLKGMTIAKLSDENEEGYKILDDAGLIPERVDLRKVKLNEGMIASIIDYRLNKGEYSLPRMREYSGRGGIPTIKKGFRGIKQGAPTFAYYATHPINAIKRVFGYKPTALERAGENYDRLQEIAKKARGKLPKDIEKNIENINKYSLYKEIIEEIYKDKLVGKYKFMSLEHALDRKVKKEGKDITDKIRGDIISAVLLLIGAFFISMSKEGMYFTGNLVREQNFVTMNGLGIGIILSIAALVVLFVKFLRKH